MKQLHEMSLDEVLAESRRRDERRARGLPFTETPAEAAERIEEDDARLEKEIEHEGDRLMLAHGFAPIRFSQPRATKQTAGICDRLYLHERCGLAVWWEAKTATGVQSPSQRDFQRMVESVGWTYLLGTTSQLAQYLYARGLWVQ